MQIKSAGLKPTLRHPSGVVIDWDDLDAALFPGRMSEKVNLEGIRLWMPLAGAKQSELPFAWLLKACRMCCVAASPVECSNYVVLFDINQTMDSAGEVEAERQSLHVLSEMSMRGVRAWLEECS